MNETNDLVSIILPVHNDENSLGACLDSLLSQTYTNLEIIAIDDCSKDASYDILKIYRKLDKRLKVSSNVKTYGKAITLNRALKEAQGHYVTFMNPKDTCTRDKTRKQVQYLLENPKIVAVGTQCVYLNEDRRRIGQSYFPTDAHVISKTIFTGFGVNSESVLINRYALPSDLLHFEATKDAQFSYTHLLVKLLRYGTFANLDQQLYSHTKKHDYFLSLPKLKLEYVRLWLRARFVYDLQLPFQTLLYPLVK